MRPMLLATTAPALGGQALAADLPIKMPVKAPIASHFSWTGCYVGGHVGVGWGRSDISEPLDPSFQDFAPANTPIGVNTGAGFLGGAQVGCDYQIDPSWVVGAAADFSWANIDGQVTDPIFSGKNGGPILLETKTNSLATATARIGYAWDRWMLYGKGGAAWAHDTDNIQNLVFWGNPNKAFCVIGTIVACNPSGSETRIGWTLGFGFEWAFAHDWSAGLEFDHYDFGTHSVTLTDLNGVPSGTALSGPVNVTQRIETVKLSLNYRFGAPGSH